jgi:dUTP pyrophosphatase
MHVYLTYLAFEPSRAFRDDTGFDLYSDLDVWLRAKEHATVPLDCRVWVHGDGRADIQVRGRSGLAKRGILCHLGTIDAGYQGQVSAILFNHTDADFKIARGDRVAQLVVHPLDAEVEAWREDLYFNRFRAPDSDRGESGFGSTGGFGEWNEYVVAE